MPNFGLNPAQSIVANVRNNTFHSFHEGGVFFLMADGAVRFISENIQHTSRCWIQPNPNWAPCTFAVRFDRETPANQAQQFGLYQRLAARNDNQVVGEF